MITRKNSSASIPACEIFQTRKRGRSRYIIDICCAVICAVVVSSALAQSEDVEFSKANQEYAQGHFKEAISGYEALVRAGQWSANLFYDLGNAYFRTGDFGHAILNYERALAIVTGKDVQARLATADTANSVLALPPGSEIKILSVRGDWVYAALPDNLRGWIPAKDAEQVRL